MRVGFACIPLGLGKPMIRTCRLANATPQRLAELIELNLATLEEALHYISGLGLRMFRISSDTIPFGSHEVNTLPWWSLYRHRLRLIGQTAERLDIRLSMHPGPYTQLGSPNERVTEAAIRDLVHHQRLLDELNCPRSSKLVIHLGGAYGDKESALARLRARLERLSMELRHRIALENDETLWSSREVLRECRRLGLPMIFDAFHHRLLGSHPPLSAGAAARLAAATWSAEDGIPKIHFSSQQPGAPRGAHAVGVSLLSLRRFLEETRGLDFDLMIEAKGKERAALPALELARRMGRLEPGTFSPARS